MRELPRRFALAILVALAAGCEPTPTAPASDAPPSRAADLALSPGPTLAENGAPATLLNPQTPTSYTQRFPVVQLDPAYSPGPGDAMANNFADALAKVEPGGTIQAHGAVYVVDEVVIFEPVTIESTDGRATIRGSSGLFNFGVATTDGPVVFKDLDFVPAPGSRASVGAIGDYGEVRIQNSTFTLPEVASSDGDAVNAAIEAGDNTSGSGRFVLEGGSIQGGRVGAYAWGGARIDVDGTTFRHQSMAGLQYQSGAGGQLDNLDAESCGDLGCVRVLSGSVDMHGGRVSSNRTDVDWRVHHVVLFSDGATGSVAGVHFDGCGYGQCLLAVRGANVSVTHSRFTAYGGQRTRLAIAVSDGSGGTEPDFASRSASVMASDNVIEGVGSSATHQRTNASAYAFDHGGVLIANGGRGTLLRNDISDAYLGVRVMEFGSSPPGSDGGVVQGSDNVIHFVWGVVEIRGSSQAFLRRNDLSDYLSPIEGFGWNEPTDLTCNWWHDGAGPQGVSASVPTSFYTPWATSPVAGTGAGGCTGGV